MNRVRIARGVTLSRNDIIGVFDTDTSTISGVTREFLKAAQKQGKVVTLEGDIPRSFLLAKDRVYTSGYTVKHMAGKLSPAIPARDG